MSRASSACHITDRLQALGRVERSTSRVPTSSETADPNSVRPGTPTAPSSTTTATAKAAQRSRYVRTGTRSTYGVTNARGRSSTSRLSPASSTLPTAARATSRPVSTASSTPGSRSRRSGNGSTPR